MADPFDFFKKVFDDYQHDSSTASFRAGVLQASRTPVMFMDPTKLKTSAADYEKLAKDPSYADGKPALQASLKADVETMRHHMMTQNPDIAKAMPDEAFEKLAALSKTHTPFALNANVDDKKVCFVNQQDTTFDDKYEMASQLSSVPGYLLNDVPGTNELWSKILGLHEGTHCNDPVKDPVKFNSDPNRDLITMRGEIRADITAIDYLNKNHYYKIAQAFLDYRSIQTIAVRDPTHATAPSVRGDTIPTNADVRAVNSAMETMINGVAKTLNISQDDAVDMLNNDKSKFIAAVDKSIKDGLYDIDPVMKKYVESYTEAQKRQVIGVAGKAPDFGVLQRIEGATPRIEQGDTHDIMKIGGVKASEFFASHANPDLAEKRLAMDKAPDAGPAIDKPPTGPAVTQPAL